MPYSPTTWVEGVTKLGPTNMNKIEQGIADAIPEDIYDAKGDLIVGTGANAYAKISVGANGRVLAAQSFNLEGLEWLDLSSVAVMLATYDAKGDLIVGTADGAASRLAVGAAGTTLIPDSAEATGMKWNKGNMVKLHESTLGGAAASFDITSIPTGYDALRLVCSLRGDTAAANTTALLRINGDSAANYDYQRISASAAAVSAAEAFGQTSMQIASLVPASTAGANLWGLIIVDIPLHWSSAREKFVQSVFHHKQGTATTNITTGTITGVWRGVAAITQLTVIPGAGNWAAASRVSLWGIG